MASASCIQNDKIFDEFCCFVAEMAKKCMLRANSDEPDDALPLATS